MLFLLFRKQKNGQKEQYHIGHRLRSVLEHGNREDRVKTQIEWDSAWVSRHQVGLGGVF